MLTEQVIGVKMPESTATSLDELVFYCESCENNGSFPMQKSTDSENAIISLRCRCCQKEFVVEAESVAKLILNSVNQNRPVIVPMIEGKFLPSKYEARVGFYINGNPKWIQIDEYKFNSMFSKYLD